MYIRCILVIGAAMGISGDTADVNRYRTPVLPDTSDIAAAPSSVRSVDLFGPGMFISVGPQAPTNRLRSNRNLGWKLSATFQGSLPKRCRRFPEDERDSEFRWARN